MVALGRASGLLGAVRGGRKSHAKTIFSKIAFFASWSPRWLSWAPLGASWAGLGAKMAPKMGPKVAPKWVPKLVKKRTRN